MIITYWCNKILKCHDIMGMRLITVLFISPLPVSSSASMTWADLGGGGVQGVTTSPNGQSHIIKYSTTDVLSLVDALIYIAKSLVIVMVMF